MARILKVIILLFPLIPSLCLYPQIQTSQIENVKIAGAVEIIQDKQGIIWFGSSNGLLKYNGTDIISFSHIPFDTTSISGNRIMSIVEYQDSILWIGAWGDGLNRFNKITEKFKNFHHHPDDPNSICSDDILSLLLDDDGSLWIGTWAAGMTHLWWDSSKIAHYDHYQHEPNNPNSLSDSTVANIFKDSQGYLWIGTNNGGLNRFDKKTREFTRYLYNPDDPYSISFNCAGKSICEDDSGNLWISTGDVFINDAGGLNRFDRKSGKFYHYRYNPNDPNSLSTDNLYSLLIDSQGFLWIGTFRKGVNSIPLNDVYLHDKYHTPLKFTHYPDLGNAFIVKMMEDNVGNIWMTTGFSRTSIFKFDRIKNTFLHYKHITENPKTLSSPYINCILEDKSGNLWFGTGNGLDMYDPRTENYSHFQYSSTDYSGINNPDNIYEIFEDQKGILWTATTMGINRFDRKRGILKNYRHNWRNYEGSRGNIIRDIFEDRFGNLWIAGTPELFIFDREKEYFTHYQLNVEEYQEVDISDICEDHHGDLWVASGMKGLFCLRRRGNEIYSIEQFQYNQKNNESISSDWLISLLETRRFDKSLLWISSMIGLDCFDFETQKFSHFFNKDILPNGGLINKIIEDVQGNLWMATSKGLLKYESNLRVFKWFDQEDGLPLSAFWGGCKRKNGEIIFCGNGGAVSFYPEDLKENPNIPPIILTDFQVMHQDFQMDTLVQYAKKIVLTYQQNFFSFKFAALNYSSPNKNKYAYKLEGIERDWIYTDAANRIANYTDIAPGKYVFRVKGSNNDGIWNETGTSIKVIILPPWWRMDWAYAGYILLIGLVIAGSWYMQVRRLRMKHQLEIEHLQASKLQEIDRVKSRFFANISHEFRTPLTLILGPLEKMLSWTDNERYRENLNIMQRSAFRLHRLIDQLLDLSKLEAGKMKLQAREVNLTDFLKPLILAFASWAETKKITLTFLPSESPIFLYLDPEMMEKVMNNLLSNALKFTPEGGRIRVSCRVNSPEDMAIESEVAELKRSRFGFRISDFEFVFISISDNGPGIPSDKLSRIFDRFFQLDDSSTREPARLDISRSKKHPLRDDFYPTGHEGSGIGLALTRELVELHHGKITVESEVGKGSTFTIQLPLGKEHLEAEEIVEVPEKTEEPIEFSQMREFGNRLSGIRDDDGPTERGTRLKEQGFPPPCQPPVDHAGLNHPGFSKPQVFIKKLPTLLIVEDHTDMRRYMADYLEKEYRIITAVDGKDGFEKSTREHLDLIISDVMMPGMDGFELCRKLKTDERTSHIPVILLTAKADAGSKLEGLELGADDYITKPFDVKELQVRVRNLIEQRRKLRERFLKELKVEPKRLAVTSLDQRLLQSVLRVVEKNLGNPQFGGETLVKELGISRANLHRKLKALTNHSAGSFIQAVRLKKAAQLIEQKFDTITQIAYLVGFNNPSYFSECFRRQFGCTPSEYSHQDN